MLPLSLGFPPIESKDEFIHVYGSIYSMMSAERLDVEILDILEDPSSDRVAIYGHTNALWTMGLEIVSDYIWVADLRTPSPTPPPSSITADMHTNLSCAPPCNDLGIKISAVSIFADSQVLGGAFEHQDEAYSQARGPGRRPSNA